MTRLRHTLLIRAAAVLSLLMLSVTTGCRPAETPASSSASTQTTGSVGAPTQTGSMVATDTTDMSAPAETKPETGSKTTRTSTAASADSPRTSANKTTAPTQPLADTVKIWTENALTDVFGSTEMPAGATESGQIHLLRNESESIQLAVRPTAGKLTDLKVSVEPVSGAGDLQLTVSHIVSVKFSKASALIGDYRRAAAGTALPEYYSGKDTVASVAKGETVSFCVEATTSAKTKAGTYQTHLVVSSREGIRRIPLSVRVYSTALPDAKDSSFDYVCWFLSAGWNNDAADQVNNTYFDATGYNENFWTLMKNYAIVLKKQRMNVINVPLLNLLGSNMTIDAQGNYHFDFTNFDRYVETFLQYGSVKYLNGSHLLDKDWYISPNDPSWPTNSTDAWIFVNKNGKVQYEWAFTDSDEAQRHLRQLLPALYAHLKEKGWDKIWIQNVCDEVTGMKPKNQVAATYDLVHELMPGIKTMDAGSQLASRYGDKLDIPTPRLDDYAKNQSDYQEMQKQSATAVWTYTCDGPQGNSMSRLNDFPLISTRALGWYIWKNDIDGYLHWAWNRWSALTASGGDPFEDMSCTGGPADGFLVYPDVENTSVFEGTRSTAMRDAIEDNELLRLAAAKRPDEVRGIVDKLIRTYQDFERNPQPYLDARMQLLAIVG